MADYTIDKDMPAGFDPDDLDDNMFDDFPEFDPAADLFEKEDA
jgi:hypothetical protein